MSENPSDLRRRGLWLLKPCTRRLIGLLSHQDPALRGEAAGSLGQIGDEEAVRPLIEAMRREKQDETLPLALAEIGDGKALEALLETFAQADRDARPNIALALGAFPDPRTVQALMQGLGDPDPNVRSNCVNALGKLHDPTSVSALLGCLSEANEWIFLSVVDTLSRIGDHRASAPLVAFYLKEPNERKRASIVTALGFLRDLTTVPTLSRALRDPDDRVKANAIEAIGRLRLPKEKALGLIQPFVRHADNRVRGNSLVLVAELGGLEMTPVFQSMREDPDKWVRATLGYVLSVVDHPKAMSLIIDLLKDGDGDVRKNAARALAGRAKDGQIEILLKLLKDPSAFVRQQAVQTLGRVRARSAIPLLSRLFALERNFKIRSAIITTLGQIGDPSALTLLEAALRDRDSRVRANAVEAVERIFGEECGKLVRPKLEDPDNRCRANAAKAMFRVGEITVLGRLEQMLVHGDLPTRLSAAYAVGQIGLALREIEKTPLLIPLKQSLESVDQPSSGPGTDDSVARGPSDTLAAGTSSAGDERGASRTGAAPAITTGAADGDGLPANKESFRQLFIGQAQAGKYKEAIDLGKTFLERYPNDLQGNLFMGNLELQLSRIEEAAAHFRRTVEIDPFHVQAMGNLGMCCYRLGKVPEAIQHFKQALKIQPDLGAVRFNLANLLLKENHLEEAIHHYEEGKRHQKPPARILANLGFAYQKAGQYEKALLVYETAVAADPRDPGVYYNWAVILIRQGHKGEARDILNRALRAVPTGAGGLKTIHDLLERLGADSPV